MYEIFFNYDQGSHQITQKKISVLAISYMESTLISKPLAE